MTALAWADRYKAGKAEYEWSQPVKEFYQDSNKAYVQNLDQNVLSLVDVTHFAPVANGSNANTATSTAATDTAAKGKQTNVGAIVGGVFGGLLALALLAALILFLLRRRRNGTRGAYASPNSVDESSGGYHKAELSNEGRKFAELDGPGVQEMQAHSSRHEMEAVRGQEVQGEGVRAEMAA